MIELYLGRIESVSFFSVFLLGGSPISGIYVNNTLHVFRFISCHFTLMIGVNKTQVFLLSFFRLIEMSGFLSKYGVNIVLRTQLEGFS